MMTEQTPRRLILKEAMQRLSRDAIQTRLWPRFAIFNGQSSKALVNRFRQPLRRQAGGCSQSNAVGANAASHKTSQKRKDYRRLTCARSAGKDDKVPEQCQRHP